MLEYIIFYCGIQNSITTIKACGGIRHHMCSHLLVVLSVTHSYTSGNTCGCVSASHICSTVCFLEVCIL